MGEQIEIYNTNLNKIIYLHKNHLTLRFWNTKLIIVLSYWKNVKRTFIFR